MRRRADIDDMDPSDRLDAIEAVLAALNARAPDVPVIVEGRKDVEALRASGVAGAIIAMNRGRSIADFCQDVSDTAASVIILTDWDRKGGRLARLLVDAFEALDVPCDLGPRRELVKFAKKDVKDVQSIHTLLERLRRECAGFGK